MSERLAIFAEGLFEKHSGKTAHGVIRYGTRNVIAVIDSTQAGRLANEVEPFCLHPVPVVASVRDAIDAGATAILIGVAPTGGKLDPGLAGAAARGDRGGARARGRPAHAALRRPRAARPPQSAPASRCATCAPRRPT